MATYSGARFSRRGGRSGGNRSFEPRESAPYGLQMMLGLGNGLLLKHISRSQAELSRGVRNASLDDKRRLFGSEIRRRLAACVLEASVLCRIGV